MTLMEGVMAALVFLLGTASAAQLWSQGLRSTWELARKEENLHRLDALLLASEAAARDLVASQGVSGDCRYVADQLLPLLHALPPAAEATPSLLPSPAGTLHLRWEAGAWHRERLLSLTALRLCREDHHGA